MSIKSFLHRLWEAIGNIFDHAAKEIKEVALPAAIFVVNQLKEVVDSDSINIFGRIAGGVGVDVEIRLRKLLPELLVELKLVQAAKTSDDVNAILREAISEIKNTSTRAQAAFYHSLAALLVHDLSDGKLTWSEAVELAEFYFKNKPTE